MTGSVWFSDDELRERHRATHRRFYELLSQASEDARLLELPGVTACIVPALPERSFPNAVTYRSADQLIAALPDLAEAYRDAGVQAWTVWVPEDDTAASRALRDEGHVLDATPTEMGAALSELDLESRIEVELDPTAELAEVVAINERAYGLEGGFAAGFLGFPRDGTHLYVTRRDGELAACVAAIDHGPDCGIELAATVPEAQGNGLCSELMRMALRDALDRGCETTTLEGTQAGTPVYLRIGYRALGVLEMWERRAVSG